MGERQPGRIYQQMNRHMPEKLAHVCPRFKEIHGGGEPVLLNLFRHLCDLGYENTVYTYNFPESLRTHLDSRVILKQLPTLFNRRFKNVLLAGFYDLFCTTFFAPRIHSQVDVVCFHTENVVPGLFFYRLLNHNKKSLYFCFQPPRFAYDTEKETARAGGALGWFLPAFKTLYRPFDRMAVRKAQCVVTFSNGYKRWIEDIYGVRDVKVLQPGVELPTTVSPIPDNIRKKISGPHVKTLICVGKLVTWKNVDRLVSITTRVKQTFENIRLLVVGDGPCMDTLKEQTARTGMQEHVVFCGYVTSDDVFGYLQAADLLVLLEKNASFGLALVEANSTGLPVMAFEGGGPSDIIWHGKNGFLLPGDISDQEVADRICRFFKDEERIKTMRAHAVRVARQYTWRRFARAFSDVILDLYDG
jgi:glycosyltransferase involved in cell wall biosynthesis